MALVTLADQYNAIDSIGEGIRSSFFEWPMVEADITLDPVSVLAMGYTLRSERVFREALYMPWASFAGGILISVR